MFFLCHSESSFNPTNNSTQFDIDINSYIIHLLRLRREGSLLRLWGKIRILNLKLKGHSSLWINGTSILWMKDKFIMLMSFVFYQWRNNPHTCSLTSPFSHFEAFNAATRPHICLTLQCFGCLYSFWKNKVLTSCSFFIHCKHTKDVLNNDNNVHKINYLGFFLLPSSYQVFS